MNNLIEIVFEDISSSLLNDFIHILTSGSVVLSIEASEMSGALMETWDGDAHGILEASSSSSAAISLNVDRVNFPSTSLLNPLVQIIRYDATFDVSLSFTKKDIICSVSKCMISALHSDAVKLKGISGGKNLYCGYEPASDEMTRFFTNNEIGPLVDFWI